VWIGLSLLLGGLAAAWPGPAGARTTQDSVIGLYIVPSTPPLTCSGITPKACSDPSATVTGGLLSYYAVLCVFGADPDSGIAGMLFGIDYNGSPRAGVDVNSWTLCGDLEFPSDSWPADQTGNIITWDNEGACQRTVPGDSQDGMTAVGGFFYLTAYSQDVFQVIEHPRLLSGRKLQVSSCNIQEFNLDPQTQAGSIGFSDDGSTKGKLPCVLHPTEAVTWGKVKNTFRH
jgi:hypothetical protein